MYLTFRIFPGRPRLHVLPMLLALVLAFSWGPTAAGDEVTRIMPLGDSITQGYAASYREPLWIALREGDWNVDFVGSMDRYNGGGVQAGDYDTDHEGHWGWFADEVLERIADWVKRSDPDIVLLHLGTNDVGTGQDPLETAGEIARIIALLRQHDPGIHVLLAAVIPVDHATANERIREYNRALAELAGSLDSTASRVLLVDQFTGFDAAQDTYDGIHPNDAGNRKMTERWLSALERLNAL